MAINSRTKGEWIHKPDIYLDEQTWECSECGEPWIFIEGTLDETGLCDLFEEVGEQE